jgi:D-alanine-D-alanine ligase-like ATP-grasp enzyme
LKICLLEPSDSHARAEFKNRQEQIRRLLEQLGHQVVEVSCSSTLYEGLRQQHPDVIFNVSSIYGNGEGHLVPAIIEMAGLPYTGSGVLALSLGKEYVRLFQMLFSACIPLPPFRFLEAEENASQYDLHYPLMLYRENGHQGTLVSNSEVLAGLLPTAASHEKLLLVERVKGRKMTVFVLDQEPLFYPLEEEFCLLVKSIYQLVEARGLARFDFVWADGPILVGIDTAPDPLDKELLRQASSAGWDEMELLQVLVEHAGRDSVE